MATIGRIRKHLESVGWEKSQFFRGTVPRDAKDGDVCYYRVIAEVTYRVFFRVVEEMRKPQDARYCLIIQSKTPGSMPLWNTLFIEPLGDIAFNSKGGMVRSEGLR